MSRYLSILFAGCLCLITTFLHAQQEAVRTQYIMNTGWINPAYYGFNDDHELFLDYRAQWTDFEGAPRDIAANYHGAVSDRVGLGLNLNSERIGALRQTNISGAFNYRFGNLDWKFGTALDLGYQRYFLKGNINNDIANDPVLMSAIDGVSFFNMGFGFYTEYMEKLYIGVNLPELLHARINDVSFEDESESGFFEQFTLLLGYRIDVKNKDIKLDPSIYIKRLNPEGIGLRNVDFQMDINLKASFLQEQLYGGLTYSFGTGDRLGALLGFRLNSFTFAYSYDVSFQEFQNYAGGSHELTFGVKWPRRNKN